MSDVVFEAGAVTFEWDTRKAAANRAKHGVSFEEAATVFADPDARLFDDPDHAVDELRFLIVGLSAATRVLLVVHLERGERIRLISARVATRRERARMEREG
jgi:hypothetical protein